MIETVSFWKILWEYCRQRRKLLCLLLVLAAINGFLFQIGRASCRERVFRAV